MGKRLLEAAVLLATGAGLLYGVVATADSSPTWVSESPLTRWIVPWWSSLMGLRPAALILSIALIVVAVLLAVGVPITGPLKWLGHKLGLVRDAPPLAQELHPGGEGGSAKANRGGMAIGGRGGAGGHLGPGGAGGSTEATDDGFAMGGEGGEGGRLDRPARGGRSPLEVLGIPDEQLADGTHLWDRGRGGDGGGPAIPPTDGGDGIVIIRYLTPLEEPGEEAEKSDDA
jgi:hypothetical protein